MIPKAEDILLPAPNLITDDQKKYGFENGNYTVDGADKLFWRLMHKYVNEKPISDKFYGTKNLVYYALGYEPAYIKLWKLSIKTIIEKHYDCDFLVICDERIADQIPEKIEDVVIHKMIVPACVDIQASSKIKCKIFDWEKINDYTKVLFLDADILATKSIDTVFKFNPNPGMLYSKTPFTKGNGHVGIYHSVGAWREGDWFRLTTRKIWPFNCGQFYFRNTEYMKYHFKCINHFMEVWPHPAFFEQAFMNCYFNALELSNTSQLDRLVCLVSANESGDDLCINYKGETLVHFAGPPGDFEAKYNRMRLFYARRFRPKIAAPPHTQNRW